MPPAQVAIRTTCLGVVGVIAILGACGGDDDSPATPPPAVASVGMSHDTSTLVPSATVQLTATPRDASGSPVSRPVTWTSSANAIARVSTAGLVTGVAIGTATITATSGGRSGTARVSVKDGGIVGAAGATLTARGGNLSLTILPNALAQQVMVTLEPSAGAPTEPRMVGSTAFDIGPAAAAVSGATLSIRYVESNIPPGPPEALLRMTRVEGTTWQDVPGSILNATANTVTATVYAFGTYAVRTPPFVANVSLSTEVATIRLGGATLALTATARDAGGNPLEGRAVTWSSSNTAIATVGASTGVVTAVAQGEVTITANVEGRTATARVTVVVPVASIAIGPASPTVDVWSTTQLTATARDADGNALTGRAVAWSSSDPTRATVSGSGLLTGLVSGSTIVTATSEGIIASVTVTVPPQPPVQVSSVAPGALVPGATFTVTGANFSPVLAANAITVGGVAATATAVTATSLTGRVAGALSYACQSTQSVPVSVTTNTTSASGTATLTLATQRSLALGETLLLLSASDNLGCNEFSITGGTYVMALLNVSSSPGSVSSYEVRGSAGIRALAANAAPAPSAGVSAALAGERTPQDAAAPLPGPRTELAQAAEAEARAHARILEQNRAVIERLGSPIRAWNERQRRRASAAASASGAALAAVPVSTTVGAINTVRVPDLNSFNICTNFFTIQARTVAVGTRVIILEDVRSPLAGTMDSHFETIAQQFDTQMFGVLQTNFGNLLALDSQLDNNGRIVMLFSPLINQTGGVLGFVVSCDFYPTTVAPGSNEGEFFYAVVPTNPATGFAAGTKDEWLYMIRSTVIHEAKHITSISERIARAGAGAPRFEQVWLEEGTARHAEELWARMVSGSQWKGNTTYAAALFCDYRPQLAQCANRARVMTKHYFVLYNYLTTMQGRSLFGPVTNGDPTFYATAWSFVRWVIDHFAQSDAAFLSALTQDNTRVGLANIEARTGKAFPELFAKWLLAMWLDDRPGVTVQNPELTFPSWHNRDIFAGMNLDFPSTFSVSSPILSFQQSFGAFLVQSSMRGGTGTWFVISGPQTSTQLIAVTGANGGPLSSTLRIAIIRVQ